MSLREVFGYFLLALLLFPLISVMLSAFIEMWFKRKEKHIMWTDEYMDERMKKLEREDL